MSQKNKLPFMEDFKLQAKKTNSLSADTTHAQILNKMAQSYGYGGWNAIRPHLVKKKDIAKEQAFDIEYFEQLSTGYYCKMIEFLITRHIDIYSSDSINKLKQAYEYTSFQMLEYFYNYSYVHYDGYINLLTDNQQLKEEIINILVSMRKLEFPRDENRVIKIESLEQLSEYLKLKHSIVYLEQTRMYATQAIIAKLMSQKKSSAELYNLVTLSYPSLEYGLEGKVDFIDVLLEKLSLIHKNKAIVLDSINDVKNLGIYKKQKSSIHYHIGYIEPADRGNIDNLIAKKL